jgi:hypothetical protein
MHSSEVLQCLDYLGTLRTVGRTFFHLALRYMHLGEQPNEDIYSQNLRFIGFKSLNMYAMLSRTEAEALGVVLSPFWKRFPRSQCKSSCTGHGYKNCFIYPEMHKWIHALRTLEALIFRPLPLMPTEASHFESHFYSLVLPHMFGINKVLIPLKLWMSWQDSMARRDSGKHCQQFEELDWHHQFFLIRNLDCCHRSTWPVSSGQWGDICSLCT